MFVILSNELELISLLLYKLNDKNLIFLFFADLHVPLWFIPFLFVCDDIKLLNDNLPITNLIIGEMIDTQIR